MLHFETLLLKQLQRQQTRAEFCDAVLQTQGVSVPVHSCVLSAFSPWLCGALTTMPPPLAGQRRLIKLQAVEACTLLSLVSLLYSGQLHDDREEVLSAAESLGIKLPQQQPDGRYAGKGTSMEWMDAVQVQDQQGETVRGRGEQERRMSGGDRERLRERGSQTENRSEMKEKETQTDHMCSDPKQSSQTVCLIGQSTCSTSQGHCVYSNTSDVTLMVPRVHSPLGKRPYTCDVLSVAPAAEACHTLSDPACVAQIYLYPSEPSYPQVPISASPQPPPCHYTCLQLEAIQSDGCGLSANGDDIVDGKKETWSSKDEERNWSRGISEERQCEVKRWRDSERKNDSPRVKRPRGRPRLHPLPSPSISHTSCTMTPANQNTTSPPVPSLLHTVSLPPVPDPTQLLDWLTDDIMPGFLVLPPVPAENQITQHGFMNTAIPNVSSVSNTTYPSMHSSIKPIDPKVSQQQPEGELNNILDNFLRTFEQQIDGCGIDFEEESSQDQSQHYTAISNSDEARVSEDGHKSGPSMNPWSNTPNTYTQLQVHRPHSDHHHPPQAEFCPHCTHASDIFTPCAQLQPMLSKAQNQLQFPSILGQQKLSCPRQQSEGQPGKLYGGRNLEMQFETQRMTRSQSIKVKLESALNSLPTPVERKRRRESREQSRSPTADTQKKRQVGKPLGRRKRAQHHADVCASDAKVSNVKTREGNGTQIWSARTKKNTTIQWLGEERPRMTSGPMRKRRVNGQGRRRRWKEEEVESRGRKRYRGAACHSGSSDQPVLLKEYNRETITEVTSSAVQKMRIFLESQREREEEHKRAEKGKPMRIHEEKERLGCSTMARHDGVSRAALAPSAKETSHDAPGESRTEQSGTREAGDKSRLTAESQDQKEASCAVEVKQRRGDMRSVAVGQRQARTEGHSTSSQLHVPLNADLFTSTQEKTERVKCDKVSMFGTRESSQSTLGSCWGDPFSVQLSAPSLPCHKDLPASPKGLMLKMADLTLDLGEKTPTMCGDEHKLLSHALLCHKLLPLHTPMKDIQESMGSLEEEDVDVLEVSSPASDQVAMLTAVWEPGPEEEEVEEDDIEVDVLGMESD
ncbi:hypothetical protein P4O66_020342 [Electrophorus voltai]|uniref:BTB domain-containing protein n=1 Tax=Electrophorus voltai TaxID=2609070 RepID=A0AAD8ZTD2_9TELE|nr:hypothetical protein P4O66_020342 [Electrophorus voltai]